MTEISQPYFQALLEISEQINSIKKPEELLESILDIAIQQLSAERGFIILKDDKSENEYEPKAVRNIGTLTIEEVKDISHSTVQKVLKDSKPLLSFDTLSDKRFDDAKSITYHKDLHRNKNIPPTYLYKKVDGYGQCLYGEHLLDNSTFNLPIILIESEKTAIISSYCMANKIWLATGGADGPDDFFYDMGGTNTYWPGGTGNYNPNITDPDEPDPHRFLIGGSKGYWKRIYPRIWVGNGEDPGRGDPEWIWVDIDDSNPWILTNSVSFSSPLFFPFGYNIEAGKAFDFTNGDMFGYVKGGPSITLGIPSLSFEFALQNTNRKNF